MQGRSMARSRRCLLGIAEVPEPPAMRPTASVSQQATHDGNSGVETAGGEEEGEGGRREEGKDRWFPHGWPAIFTR